MIKDFLLRKVLAAKLKDVPAAEREKILTLIEKNPELFQKFGFEIQSKVASGQDQMAAIMSVMKEHEVELKELLGSK